MMLRYLNLPMFADTLSKALKKTLNDGRIRTFDIGGNATTDEFTNEVINNCQTIMNNK